MPQLFIRLASLVLCTILLPASALAIQGMGMDSAACLGCHSNKISGTGYLASVHGGNSCTSCHAEISDLGKHMRREIVVAKVNCARCHQKEAVEHSGSVHVRHNILCINCHSTIHEITPWKGDKRQVVSSCIRCHQKESVYLASVHGRAVAAGKKDAAACNDCHSLHAIKKIGPGGETQEFHSRVCMRCHSDQAMMQRNGVFPVAVKTYLESYHGKNYRLGYPERTAGCADCHTPHAILPIKDPASSVNPENRVRVCQKCHPKATPLFAQYYAHGDHRDREKYPILFWTFLAMSGLLVGTFVAFWIHSALWMFRGFIENREKPKH